MATVKSLEERLDDFSEELDALKVQFGTVTSKLDTLAASVAAYNAQTSNVLTHLATIAARLDALSDAMKVTNGRLEGTNTRLDGLLARHAGLEAKFGETESRARETSAAVAAVSESHIAFKAKGENTFAFLRWVGGFAAVSLFGIIGSAWTVTNSMSRLDANIQQQQKTLDEIRRELGEIRSKQK